MYTNIFHHHWCSIRYSNYPGSSWWVRPFCRVCSSSLNDSNSYSVFLCNLIEFRTNRQFIWNYSSRTFADFISVGYIGRFLLRPLRAWWSDERSKVCRPSSKHHLDSSYSHSRSSRNGLALIKPEEILKHLPYDKDQTALLLCILRNDAWTVPF